MLTEIFLLLIAFQVKHLIADYYLQGPYIYENKGKSSDWILPLFTHAYTHAGITWLIIVAYALIVGLPFSLWYFILPFIDLASHFYIDRWKATQGVGPDTAAFWNQLGIDQMLHHLVGIYIVYTLVI